MPDDHSIEVVPYDPAWPHRFDDERAALERCLAPWNRTHGLHLTEVGTDLWCERLAFRDALRADPALASAYEELKRRLARLHGADTTAYTLAKRPFVTRVLAGAGIDIPPTSPR